MACRQLCSSRDSHPLLNVVHQPSQCAQQHGVHGTDAHVCAQVVGKLCNACHLVATAAPTIAKSDAHLVISGLVEKMSDVKVKPCAFELLTSLAEVRCACALCSYAVSSPLQMTKSAHLTRVPDPLPCDVHSTTA